MIRNLLIFCMIANSAFLHAPAHAASDVNADAKEQAAAAANTSGADQINLEIGKLVRQFLEANDAKTEGQLAEALGTQLLVDLSWYKYFTGIQMENIDARVKYMESQIGALKAKLSADDIKRKVAVLDAVVTRIAGEIGLESEEARKNAVYFAGMTLGMTLTVLGTRWAVKSAPGKYFFPFVFGLTTFAVGTSLSFWIVGMGMQTQTVANFATQDIDLLRRTIDQTFGNADVPAAALPEALQSMEKFVLEQTSMMTWGHRIRQYATLNPKTAFLLGNTAISFDLKVKYVQRNYQKLHSFDIMTDIDGKPEQNERIAHVEMQSLTPFVNDFEIKDKNGTIVGYIKTVYDLKKLSRLYEISDAKKKLIAKSDNGSIFTINLELTSTNGGARVASFKQDLLGQTGLARLAQQFSDGSKFYVGDKWTVNIASNEVDRRIIMALPMIKTSVDDIYVKMAHAAKDAAKGIAEQLLKGVVKRK